MKYWPMMLFLLVWLLGLSACQSSEEASDVTALPSTEVAVAADTAVPTTTAVIEPTDTPIPATATAVPTPTVEPIIIERLDGSTEAVPPLTPTSYNQLLDAKIESGAWTEGEGLVQLLRLFTGELTLADLPEAADVTGVGGTAIVHRADEYMADEANDVDTRTEIKRLLAALVPTQEVLDLISVPAAEAASGKPTVLSKSASQASVESCQVLAAQGFDKDYFDGDHCYVYDEAQVNGYRYRVYYPTWWQDDETKKPLIDSALLALTDSAATFTNFGVFKDVYLMFSLLPDPLEKPGTVTDGLQGYIHDGLACPLTMFPAAKENGIDAFMQAIAHEAFHCFQDWNFDRPAYNNNAWWLEGSAEFFSNVVYQDKNNEYAYLEDFDDYSINKSLLQMDYENFLFFQYLANRIGETGVINLLEVLKNGGGTAEALAGYADMDRLFQEFVVAYMGPGIKDTNGNPIPLPTNPRVVRVEPVDQEGEETFAVSAFVAARFRLEYEQERRFLQEGSGEGDGRHSLAEFALRQDVGSWSDLPPEVRSSCREDTPYALVITTVDNSREFTFNANVNTMEIAECDPCLLGTWEIDPDSFEAFLMGLFEQYGAGAGVPAGTEFTMTVDGHDYVQFLEEGDMLTQREDFVISMGTNQGPAFVTTINAQGSGKYSADGEELTVSQLVDIVTELRGEIGGISVTQNLSAGTYSFFGNTVAGPGLDGNVDGPASTTAAYVCTQQTLTIDQPQFGEVVFNRVDKILPTPVPTPSP